MQVRKVYCLIPVDAGCVRTYTSPWKGFTIDFDFRVK